MPAFICSTIRLALVILLSLAGGTSALKLSAGEPSGWPGITSETRPWTRWWWMGSAVTPEGITRELESFKEAGLGGVEITPIYGVAGHESRFIPYLSGEWMRRLQHTLREAERLELGVDMATGTGWPFGGPWVEPAHACRNLVWKTYQMEGGARLKEPVVHTQQPLLRKVGNTLAPQFEDLYESGNPDPELSRLRSALALGARRLTIEDLIQARPDPYHLQALALDQVRFPRPLPLQALMAYSEEGEILDLTGQVDDEGRLDWVAPEGTWVLYAAFAGWHGKRVERAAPGGEGDVIDHFSSDALRHYLDRFDRAFEADPPHGLRAFFNDSYEVDDARGQADWTPALFEAFQARRGYDLRRHLPALLGRASAERNARVLCDYRETISELLLENFTRPWRQWAHRQGAIIRNQAHGSPANLLDLYGASDIPEAEGDEILRFKFASSAAHVAGKRLVSSESATWLNEHFTSSLADVKSAIDRFFVGGINHVFYHGSNYSPESAPWPGWLFYAAVHFNPRNPWWRDFPALNHYIARTQSFLQAGLPDNDLLLYFPIHDSFARRGNALLQHQDGMRALQGTDFAGVSQRLLDRGYGFDFVSDRQLSRVTVREGRLWTGDVAYRAVLVPRTTWMPLPTLERLLELAGQGAVVCFHQQLPEDVPGLGRLGERREAFQALLGRIRFTELESGLDRAEMDQGVVLLGNDMERLLAQAGVVRETMVDRGLQWVRRRQEGQPSYFVLNTNASDLAAWIPLQRPAEAWVRYYLMEGTTALATTQPSTTAGAEIYLQLAAGESCVLRGVPSSATNQWTVQDDRPGGQVLHLTGPWQVEFLDGGPERPASRSMVRLRSWNELGDEALATFSGTARYSLAFPRPVLQANAWRLDLGRVHHSARLRLNGKKMGTLIGPTYRVRLDAGLFQATNHLEIEVSNLMANRIAHLDRQDRSWKKFYNINFPPRRRENRGALGLFDASDWEPPVSGLIGPVLLSPLTPAQPERQP